MPSTSRSDRGETSWVHPQLGKWAIAAGILGEGNRPFGWRVSAAAAGTALCVMVALISSKVELVSSTALACSLVPCDRL